MSEPSAAPPLSLLLTCEHASARVPARWKECFRSAQAALSSHRGSDLGALAIARHLARTFGVDLLATRTTRLLADANRSAGHRALFSEFTRELPASERAAILALDWEPHRQRVRAVVDELLARGSRVLHVSVHSFTPVWDGEERAVDIGLLYDPARLLERRVVDAWLERLRAVAPFWRHRRNAPYRGTSDGLTRTLRFATPPERYAGLELEVNQALAVSDEARRLRSVLARTLREVLEGEGRADPLVPRGESSRASGLRRPNSLR